MGEVSLFNEMIVNNEVVSEMYCRLVTGHQRAVVFIHRRSISHASEQTGASKTRFSLSCLFIWLLVFAVCRMLPVRYMQRLTACQHCA